MMTENNEQQDILKDMALFLKRTTKIHILTYIDDAEKSFWRIALCSDFVAMPRKEKVAEVEVFQIWGNPSVSSVDKKTSKDACEETVQMLAHMLLVQGYEVFISNEEFDPLG